MFLLLLKPKHRCPPTTRPFFFVCFYGFQTSVGKMRGFVEMLSDNLLSPEIRETALLTKTFCQLSHEKTLVGWVI